MTDKLAVDVPATFEKCDDCGRFAFPEGKITLSVDDYQILKTKAALADLGAIQNYRKLSGTRIARHPEYADFVSRHLPTMAVSDIMTAFVKEFGEGKISRSQLYRFANDMGFRRER